ncbi:MAG TPA: TRAP transporter substrate-binding protein DctP [Chondromyces sp.]|nr:TRAP transporter substrate-binding protein DctP [Chondromyces sp.]
MKKMKYAFHVLLVLLLLLITGCGNSGESASTSGKSNEKITLRVATGLSAQHGWVESLMVPWTERVEELTEGQVEFEVFTDGELVKAAQEPDALKNGLIDVGLIIPFYSESQFPLSAVTFLPAMELDVEKASNALKKLMESDVALKDGKSYYDSEYKDNGLFALTVNTGDVYTISTTGYEYDSVDKFKGTSLRTANLNLEMYAKNIGVNSVTMTAVEMFDALSKGAFEGSFYGVADWTGFGFQDLFKYTISGLSIGASNGTIAMKQEKWDGLPKNVQEAMIQAHEDVFQGGIDDWKKRKQENIEYNKSKGGKFVQFDELDPAVQKKLIDGMEKTWLDYIDYLESNGQPGKELAMLWRDLILEEGGKVPEGIMNLK